LYKGDNFDDETHIFGLKEDMKYDECRYSKMVKSFLQKVVF
jgi:hypothetical protein